ncbi:MAG: hypothetical protein ACTHMS_09735 [Jatrophihabitans sp.]|uniref:hypothetical protein n=1 Tax=Jatrophihabitans sp. TaxID=1932789 RepID=UPI003F823500
MPGTSPASDSTIIPILLTVNGRTGVTLYAPPWEDEDGEEWQGFLGDGAKILLYASTRELAQFIASGEENDLSDHPAYGQVLGSTPDDLRPDPEDHYDLDGVYEWASGDPDPVHISALANVVDMVAKIADCCDDGALRRLVEGTPAYAELVDEDITYQGRDGAKRWNELGDTIAETWERALGRVESWLRWEGDFDASDLTDGEDVWDRVGAQPIALMLRDGTYYTVRADIPASSNSDETEVGFLGADGRIAVFTEVADLARYCRTATDHPLQRLEWWGELADVDDDAAFAPTDDEVHDLRKPSAEAAELLRELADFCRLEGDTDVLDGPTIDKDDWNALVDEVRTCFDVE